MLCARFFSRIKATGKEGDNAYPELVARLETAAADTSADPAPASGVAINDPSPEPFDTPVPPVPTFPTASVPAEAACSRVEGRRDTPQDS